MVQFSVVIVGGGMVGAALACALGQADITVALIEASSTEPGTMMPADPDLRVSALTRASEQILTQLGVWQHIPPQRLQSFREMHVWESQQAGAIHFDCAEICTSHLGHVLENSVVLRALWQQLTSYPSVQVFRPEQVVGFQLDQQPLRLRLQGGTSIQASLLVAADGGQSQIRRLAGLPVRRHDYAQKALVATVQTSFEHCRTAWQRFLPDGPLAFLPLADGRCSIVWSNASAQAEALQEMPAAQFLLALEDASEGVLGPMKATSARALFPLQRQYAPKYVKPQLALVGDAAHIIHPLAGQGVNLGLLDIGVLSELIQSALQRGRNPGSYTTVRRYERWRKGQNMTMMWLMEAFHLLFTKNPKALQPLRRNGFRYANRMQPMKRLVMRHAAGLVGDLPALAKEQG